MRIAIFVGLAIASLLGGCDLGYRMNPVGMGEPDSEGRWHKKFPNFELETESLHGLVGERWLRPEMTISTEAAPVTIDSVDLRTGSNLYTSKTHVLGGSYLKDLPVDATWSLPEGAGHLFGRSARIAFHLDVDGRKQVAEIEYQKADCC